MEIKILFILCYFFLGVFNLPLLILICASISNKTFKKFVREIFDDFETYNGSSNYDIKFFLGIVLWPLADICFFINWIYKKVFIGKFIKKIKDWAYKES
jgi:hypothetical protein